MVTISFYKVQNNQGQQLLDQYVRPICDRLGLRLLEARPNANRGDSLASQFKDDFILWDCSVEDGHVYHALNEWVKNTKKHIIVSRTPLPRNVLTFHQCAPIHSHKLSNAEIGHWLEPYLRGLLSGDSHALEAANDRNKVFASLYWRSEHPANMFLSFRGSQQEAAERWSKQFTRETKLTLRMVPKQLYAYETECVSRQQMWEGVAHLNYEIKATGKAAIFLSDDYFDSFWTCSEPLSLIRWPRNIDGTTINSAYIVSDCSSTELRPLAIETPSLPVPNLTRKQANRFWRILNNSDPLTSGPDTRIPPSGPAKILAFILRSTLGYYDPEFTANLFGKLLEYLVRTVDRKNVFLARSTGMNILHLTRKRRLIVLASSLPNLRSYPREPLCVLIARDDSNWRTNANREHSGFLFKQQNGISIDQ